MLGNENDAVVVTTKDISEPTFFTYQNASDYIQIAGHVYTRPKVNQTLALLQQVWPQSCVDYSQSPAQLKPSCLLPFALTMTLGFGTKTTIQISVLPVQQYIRFAFLTDVPGKATLSQIQSFCLPWDPFLTPGIPDDRSTKMAPLGDPNAQSPVLPPPPDCRADYFLGR